MYLIKNIHSHPWAMLSIAVLGGILSTPAQAVPSFARQTGMACTACHTQAFGPNLNTYGRQFKLNGYTWGDANPKIPALSAMIVGSFTNTDKKDDSLPRSAGNHPNQRFNQNNNFAFDEASLFYAGRIYKKAGAFVQLTYDGVADRLLLGNTDIRVADQQDWMGQSFVYGVSFNNSPTTQDVWNTTPVWGFPYAASPIAATPAAGPVIGAFGGQVGGATLYTLINDLVYLEAGAYTSFSQGAQRGMGTWGGLKIQGGAPYWRMALQKEWNGHYVSLGHFGFSADVVPDLTIPSAHDSYTDLGVDFNYQYLADPKHIYEFKASYINEQQKLSATYAGGQGADKLKQNLSFLGMNASYTYDQTYTASLGFNHNFGTTDFILNGYSTTGRPNSEYFTAEIDYVPFGKETTLLSSLTNLRLALQYVGYTQFNGAVHDDGTGRNRRASNNNTLFLNGWISF